MVALSGAETIAANRFIYGKLVAAVGVGKAFPGVAPRGTAMPYVLYQLMPLPVTSDTTALGGIRVMARLRYLVKVVAATLTEAEPLVLAIDAALQDSEGAANTSGGTYYVGNVQRSEPYEMPTVEDDELYWQTGGFYDLEVSAGV